VGCHATRASCGFGGAGFNRPVVRTPMSRLYQTPMLSVAPLQGTGILCENKSFRLVRDAGQAGRLSPTLNLF
jgi:hypothetical protein